MRQRWALLGAVALLGCSAEEVGQIVIAVQADVHMPKDIDTIRVEVRNEGVPKFELDYERLGTDESPILLPGTLTLVGSDNPGDTIQIMVAAFTGGPTGEVRIVREAVTTIPEARTATLQLPLQFLCDDSGEIIGQDVASTCPEGQTCLAGTCADEQVDSSTLPDFRLEDIYQPGLCIDVAVCFNTATVATVAGDCSIDPQSDTNIALQLEGDGICGAVGCFVALDGESALGWQTRDDGRIQLPPAVCDQIDDLKIVNVVTAPTNDVCPFKTVGVPTCGPWSAAGEGSGAGGPIVLAGGQPQPVALEIGPGAIYWTATGATAGEGTVKAVDFDGGTPLSLSSGQTAPRDILAQGTTLFWSTAPAGPTGSIERLDDNGQVALVPGLTLPEGITANATTLFWTEFGPAGGIWRADLAAPGTPILLATGNYPFRVAADGNVVYWTNEGTLGSDPPDGSVARYSSAGGLETIASQQETPRALTLDIVDGQAIALYWTTFADSGAVVRVSIDNGALGAEETIASGQNLPNGVAVDDGFVYWTNRGDGTVMRLDKQDPGGTPEELSTQNRAPSTITVDPTSVYWVNEGTSGQSDGAIVRLAKPQ